MGFVARRMMGAVLMLAGGVAALGYAFSLTGPASAKLSDDGDPLGQPLSPNGDVMGLLASLTLVSMGAGVLWRSPRRSDPDPAP
jgi:hypothetical protein